MSFHPLWDLPETVWIPIVAEANYMFHLNARFLISTTVRWYYLHPRTTVEFATSYRGGLSDSREKNR